MGTIKKAERGETTHKTDCKTNGIKTPELSSVSE